MSNYRLELGEIERLLLASGLWVVSGREEPSLSVSPSLLDSNKIRHQLILRAVREKMLPMLVAYMNGIGWKVTDELLVLNNIFRIMMDTFYRTMDTVIDRLSQAKIQVLMLKGGDLALTAYQANPGMPRIMRDIDILVKPPDIPAVESALSAEGFSQGRPNRGSLTMSPLSPAEIATYQMLNHYELPRFYKFVEVPALALYAERTAKYLNPDYYFISMVGGSAYITVKCDVHFNVSRDIDLQDIWNEPRQIVLPSGHNMLTPSLTDLLWILASRFYHEVMQSNGVIRQFIDLLAIVVLGGQHLDWSRILAIAEKYELRPSLYYIFVHVNEFLGPVIPQTVIDSCYPAQPGVRRDHDWGDLMPKLLGSVAITPVLGRDKAKL